MNTAVINVKVQPELKIDAQNLAEEMGFSVSSLVNALLRQVVRTRVLVVNAAEEPSDYLLEALKESREDIRAGRVSPSFKTAQEAIKWLERSKKKRSKIIIFEMLGTHGQLYK